MTTIWKPGFLATDRSTPGAMKLPIKRSTYKDSILAGVNYAVAYEGCQDSGNILLKWYTERDKMGMPRTQFEGDEPATLFVLKEDGSVEIYEKSDVPQTIGDLEYMAWGSGAAYALGALAAGATVGTAMAVAAQFDKDTGSEYDFYSVSKEGRITVQSLPASMT